MTGDAHLRAMEESAVLDTLSFYQSPVEYIMELENLVRWFALLFSYKVYDTETGEEEIVQNEPIWTVYDESGNYLADNERLQRTWRSVMGEQ